MKNVVVVESPSKTKKLASFLGKDFEVLSSVGHVRDLPKSGLGVDVDNNFEPEYIISPDKKDVVRALKKSAKGADAIYLATDLDREGEAIAWHVAFLMNNEKYPENSETADANYQVASKVKNADGQNPKVYRVTFNSITKDAVLEGFKHPRKLDEHLIDAQQGRRVLDRLVGYKLSPLLWEKIRYGLSAGRVQSVAVRLICEREKEINAFNKLPYYEIFADFGKSKDKLLTKLVKIDDESIYQKEKFKLFASEYTASKTTIDSEEDVKKALEDINKSEFAITQVESKDTKSHPSPPFATATMQQAASSNLGYTPARTMQLAQKLYEGGFITYMRTDSININADTVKDIRKFIKGTYGDKYMLAHERHFKGKKGARTQEAHEGIRPTNVSVRAEELPKSVTPQQRKVYELIWRRTIASQMAPAVFGNTKAAIENLKGADKKYTFEAKGSVIKFDGYLKVYSNKKKDEILPEISEGDAVKLLEAREEAKEMSAPPRYNESSLVRELESFNIGRPSTYASIISTIQTRGYVKKNDNRSLYPTDNGIVVNDLLTQHFPQIVDVDFTAEMEEGLDEVAEGNMDWRELLKDFYKPFETLVAEKKKEIKKEDVVIMEKTDEKCPECEKGHLIVKLGKFGKFFSCDQYPDCKFARPIENEETAAMENEENEAGVVEEIPDLKEKCPECQGQLTLKEGRFGKFIACENYPKCKYTKAILKKAGMKCPKCGDKEGGEVVLKRTKRQKVFFGCSNYPKCDYASWTKPIVDENGNVVEAEKKAAKAKKTKVKKKTVKKKKKAE